MLMKRLIPLIAISLLGCAPTLTPKAASIEHQVPKACKLIDTLEGHSILNGWIFPALERAKAEVLEEAAKRGATHVQWLVLDEVLTGATAVAKAYACPERLQGRK